MRDNIFGVKDVGTKQPIKSKKPGAGSIVGGAAQGAAAGSVLGPWGTAGGAVLGGLMAAMGDDGTGTGALVDAAKIRSAAASKGPKKKKGAGSFGKVKEDSKDGFLEAGEMIT